MYNLNFIEVLYFLSKCYYLHLIWLNKTWNTYFFVDFTSWSLLEKSLLNFRDYLKIHGETTKSALISQYIWNSTYPNVETNEKCRDFCSILEDNWKYVFKLTKSAEISQHWTYSIPFLFGPFHFYLVCSYWYIVKRKHFQ